MGKGTDKLYITHSEWASADAFSASRSKSTACTTQSFKRLPYNFCALSLQPFTHPVATFDGTVFELTHILPWLKKHGTNPVTGKPMSRSELFKLAFAQNDSGEYIDPVTSKPFTDSTHIVALKTSGNVFSWDTIERLNIKAKHWQDLVSDEEFARKDIVVIQDPLNLSGRNLSSFEHLRDSTPEPTKNLSKDEKVLKAKSAIAASRASRLVAEEQNRARGSTSNGITHSADINGSTARSLSSSKPRAQNATNYTTGKAAASFTSTGLTPHTGADLALLSLEDYLLVPKRVTQKGYVQLRTTHGNLMLELFTEHAPKAVWNFVNLAKEDYYKSVNFHRNIRGFMIQGGDPTGTGKGGRSVWGKPFKDEVSQSPLKHAQRGVLSMANKGKDTNTSQFFITYRKASHLDNKHTIFGHVILQGEGAEESETTLKRLESVPTGSDDKPEEKCTILEALLLVDPFEEYKEANQKVISEMADQPLKNPKKHEMINDDDVTTWSGKRIKKAAGSELQGTEPMVGKYLGLAANTLRDENVGEFDYTPVEPTGNKRNPGGFGNFDNW